MQGKVVMERGEQSDWCARQLKQLRRMNDMAHDRTESWARGKAGRRARQGAEHVWGQVKWQNRADRRTQKCETERRARARAGQKAGLRAGQDKTGQDRTGQGRAGYSNLG